MRILLKRPLRDIALIAVVVALAPAAVLLVLRVINPPASAFMTLTAVRLHAEHPEAEISQDWVGLDAIASCMPLAAVAGEDQTFPTNHGFVWSAIERAIKHNANGGTVHGASTITQQTAKNLFLWPAKSYIRKGIEAYITLWMDLLWSKRRVMEVYLNVAQFSDTVFGVQAAAKQLFHTDAADLSRRQCAVLAAVLPAPSEYDAANPSSYVAGRRAWILRQMRHLGPHYLDEALGMD
ncbi:monofunctional biosynthetic peptidoglycan transglycosylase [Salinisphaera sp.]|uniref:monofunctional biosynthetic peptidoglycan transglycosylase n=1 Tax=Salinisphaera sp. TaxID=1914330 RepID=UPI002D7A1E62|nr:monofunctional biosynthetic peptidoglycan transglycosylase [Salinisphaera sp.]HET7312820.1 monofunctional biosynthetic peptidoglycan transglycosylase [Salinisphaera sp.]